MSSQLENPEKNNTKPLESILDGEVTSYINGYIDQNAIRIIAAAEEKARLAAQRIIDKARGKAEAEVDRIILESRAEVEKNAEQTIKEAEEKVSWFVVEVSTYVMEEAQAMKKEIISRLVEKRSNQIIAKAREKATSAAQQIVVKAREKAEAEARIIIEKAKEAADRSVQEIAKCADEEADRLVIEVRDAEGEGAQSKKADEVQPGPAAVSECKEIETETAGSNVQEIVQDASVEAAPAVAEVNPPAVAEEQSETEDAGKQATGKSELTEVVPLEARQESPEMAKEAEDKSKGRVIEFVPDNDGGKDKAAELLKEELIPVAPKPPENAAPLQESTAVEKPEEPSITGKDGDTEKSIFYKDLVQLTLLPPIALDHMLKLHKQLKNTPNVKVMELTGTLDKGVKIGLFLTTPVPLLGIIEAIPEVEKALDLNEKKPVHAGHQKGSEPMPQAIVIKMKK